MNFEKLQKEKEKRQREEKLFSLLEVISKNVPKEQLDFGEQFDDLKKVLESQSNGDNGDYLEILIQDDLTALDSFTIKAQDHSDV